MRATVLLGPGSNHHQEVVDSERLRMYWQCAPVADHVGRGTFARQSRKSRPSDTATSKPTR